MAVNYPTADEVKHAFAAAFPAGQVFDPQRWGKLEHGVLNPTWELAGEGIEVLQVAGARLLKVRWAFGIHKMNTSSEAAMHSSAAALQQRLSALYNGENVSFDTPRSQVKEEGSVTIVQCWTRGIIG